MTKYQLFKICNLNNKIKFLKKERENIESDIEFIKYIGKQSPLSEKRAQKITENIEKTNYYKNRIENIINKEKDEMIKQILWLKYVSNLTLKEISDTINYSTSTISKKLKKYGAM